MTKKIIIMTCDLCGKELTLSAHDDFSKYEWDKKFHNGRTYDLCPEHSILYDKIISEFDEKLNKFFNE